MTGENGSKIHVLIVEDDYIIRESMDGYLQLSGFEVTAASNAIECYRAMASNEFDVALVDISLPDQSGYVICEYIRNNSHTKIIIQSALGAIENKVMGYDSGADLYLVKPLHFSEMTAAIKSLVKRHQVATKPQHAPQKPQHAPPCHQPEADEPVSFQATDDLWTLFVSSWALLAPDDVLISLTNKEMQFLKLLVSIPGTIVGRDVLLAELYLRNDEYTNRSLDSLVKRLRAKVTDVSTVPVPIKTAHSVGYCFSATLKVV